MKHLTTNRGRYRLIQLTWLSHIYQQRPEPVFDESMDAGTKLQRFPHWPVLKGSNVLVSWFQVARIVKDDSLCSLVAVVIKPPCERWGQLYGPQWLPGNCILQSDGVDMLIHDTIFIIYNINIHIWCKAAFIIVSVRKRRCVSALSWIRSRPPVGVFFFSSSFLPEIKETYFPKHLIIPLSSDDVVGLRWWEDFILEDAAHDVVHLIYLSWSWMFPSFPFNISNYSSWLTSPAGEHVPAFLFPLRDLVGSINQTAATDLQDQMKVIIQHHLPSTRRFCSTACPACPPLSRSICRTQTELVEHNVAAPGDRRARALMCKAKHLWSDDINFLFVL